MKLPDLSQNLRTVWRKTPLWARSLDQSAQDSARSLLTVPSAIWPGDEARGQELLDNYFTFRGETHSLEQGMASWVPPAASSRWLINLNSFAWLADLKAVDDSDARAAAGNAVANWVVSNRRFHSAVWDEQAVAQRIVNWLTHLNFITAARDPSFLRVVVESVARQTRFLAKRLPRLQPGTNQIRVAKALIATGVCLDGCDEWRFLGFKALEAALSEQLLPDGGHISRSPLGIANCLRDLIEVRTLLFEGGRDQPDNLTDQILGLASALQLFVQNDGSLAHMNAVPALGSKSLQRLLSRAGETAPAQALPNMGFLRVANRRGLLITDCAGPPPAPFDTQAHAGASSFEYAIGTQRLIVNCGSPTQPELFQQTQRFTAAHSTINIADRHSSDLEIDKYGTPIGFGARRTNVTAHHDHYDAFDLIQIEQDGYQSVNGGLHRRTLQLDSDGEQLDGEDHITGCTIGPVDLRFHLHPDVKPRNDGSSVFLRLPQGRGWTFSVTGGNIRLSPSIYFDLGHPRETAQIIVRAEVQAGSARIRWTLSREGRAARSNL